MTETFIHPSAHVEKGADIGEGTKIWINAQVRSTARIGENCNIGKDTYIDSHVTVGNRVKIQNGVSVYRGVKLCDDVFVGPNVTFTNDSHPRSFNTDWTIIETLVETGASIGANSTIICGNTLGEYCMVGAGSVVTMDVSPYALVQGNPARQSGYVCRMGHRLNKRMECPECGFVLKNNWTIR